MIDSLSIAFYAFARDMLTFLSVNEMLLMKYVNWPTNFRDLPFKFPYEKKSAQEAVIFISVFLHLLTNWCSF